MRVRRWLSLAVAVVLVAAGTMLGYARWRSGRTVDITPSGAYPVGLSRQEWVDRSRIDQFAPLGGTPRVFSAWIWYPAVPGDGPPAPYAPDAWRGLHRFGWAQTNFDRIQTGVRAEPRPSTGSFPLVVLMPGLGFSAPQYQVIASSLAARGYVVVGITPTYSAQLSVLSGRAVPASAAGDPSSVDGPVADQLVAEWAADARFASIQAALRFGPTVDPRRIVYAGHSFGGAAALEACRTDQRCAGAADLDGTPFGPVVTEGLGKPLLLLSSGTDGVTDHRLSGRPLRAYAIRGTRHFAFSDYGVYHLAWPLRRVLPLGSLDGRRALDIVDAYLGAFADNVTRGVPWNPPAAAEVHNVEFTY